MTTFSKMLSLASVAVTLSSAAAFAQVAPSTSQPAGAPPVTVVIPSEIPWHTFEATERRYKVEAMRFKARDETGIDWLGSDEVMVETRDAKGWTVSNEIGNIDSGDTHNFDPTRSCIIAVRPGTVILGKTSVCDDVGEPAPLRFGVEFWEKDASLPPPAGHHAGPHCANDERGDDLSAGLQSNSPCRSLKLRCLMSATNMSEPSC